MSAISVPIVDLQGQPVGTFEFDSAALADRISKQLLHDVVVMYQANLRQGTARTRSRGEIAGSTKKIYRQKGTGRARMGTKRTPIRRGGGHTFNKMPRDWSYRLPRKAIRLATRMALLSKFQDNQVTLVDALSLTEAKTRHVAGALKRLGIAGESCLIAIEKPDAVLHRCTRNLPRVSLYPVAEINAYELLRQRRLLLTKPALEAVLSARSAEAAEAGSAAGAASA